MPIFQFSALTTTSTGGPISGTLGPGGPAFTFSYSGVFAQGSGTDIEIIGSSVFTTTTLTGGGGTTITTFASPIPFTGTFTFSNTSIFLSNFQLDGSGSFTNLSVVTTGGSTLPAMLGAPFSGNVVSFTISGVGGLSNILDFVTSDAIQCFCAGTYIETADGPVAVEDLTVGTEIVLADGTTSPLRWLGRQEVPARYLHPAKINPICITAGALGDGLPERDLYVSGDHAIVLDGFLVNASALVNGRTIYQVRDMPQAGFTYYHIELDTHSVLLAEGCATESYVDIPDRSSFVNGEDRVGAPPIQEMNLPRISSHRLLPDSIKARLGIEDTMIAFNGVNAA